jgi:hypothetical protein
MLGNCTVAMLTGEVANWLPDKTMAPVIASAPFTMIGLLLVVTSFPRRALELADSLGERTAPLAKTETLTTAISRSADKTGRTWSRMVFTLLLRSDNQKALKRIPNP